MNEIVLTKLVKITKEYVMDLFSKHAKEQVPAIVGITLEERAVRVVLATPQDAIQAVKKLNLQYQSGRKQLKAEKSVSVVPLPLSPPAPSAPPVPSPVQATPAPASRPVTVQWGEDRRRPAPYHFVAVEPTTAATGTLAGVDHAVLDLSGALSGELQCTLTVLTPLLAANDQYEWEHASREIKEAFERMAKQRMGGVKQLPKPISDKKKILEPLTLTPPGQAEPGPVLIPGAAIKGMLRQSLAALLSAPMERVAEHSMSYRPNIKTVTQQPTRRALPALVVGGGGLDKQKRPQPVQVVVLRGLSSICYVRPEAEINLPARVMNLKHQNPTDRQANYASQATRVAFRLSRNDAAALGNNGVGLSQANILKANGPNSTDRLEGWLPVVNPNGIDLVGELNRRFHAANPELAQQLSTKSPEGYCFLLLDVPDDEPEWLEAELVVGYYESLRHLADADVGHLHGGHPLREKKDDVNALTKSLRELLERGLLPGDVLFLERSSAPSGNGNTSAGHHFYYRHSYRDTVHKTQTGQTSMLRDILCPTPLEQQADATGCPAELSAARLMFGYVGTSSGQYNATEPLTFGIGLKEEKGQRKPSDFSQFAGRIAINMAVEVPEDAKRESQKRFLNVQYACLTPLRPLGAPKPSAVEHYLTQDERLWLRQDNGILCTYGDTPDDASAGQLRGRKFYLHQPLATSFPDCYELTGRNHPDWKAGESFHLLIDQAGIGRFISKPDTRFRFAVRFTNLRLWELGALMLTTQPELDDVRLFASCLPDGLRGPLMDWITRVEQRGLHNGAQPLLAHKLGHGRPLGMGSVSVKIDRLIQLVRDEEANLPQTKCKEGTELKGLRTDAITALARYLCEQARIKDGLPGWVRRCLIPWLQIHRYAGRTRFDYPRDQSQKSPGDQGRGERTIFNAHSNLRAWHAEGRKKRPGTKRDRFGLQDLDNLEEQ